MQVSREVGEGMWTGELSGAVVGGGGVYSGGRQMCVLAVGWGGGGCGRCWRGRGRGQRRGRPMLEATFPSGALSLVVMAVGRSQPWSGLCAPSQVPFHRQWFCESIICSSPGGAGA